VLLEAALHVGVMGRTFVLRHGRDLAGIARRRAGPVVEVSAVEECRESGRWLVVLLRVNETSKNKHSK
jgi:hypothetical protein